MHITLVQGPGDDEHHVVNHVAVCAVVQELGQRLICLQRYAQISRIESQSAWTWLP